MLLSALSLAMPAHAQLYQTQGQAFIENGDTGQARTKAIENALNKALLVAGASVSSVQQVVNGLLTQDNLSIRASGIVSAIEIIDEVYQGDTVVVSIRADIFPQDKQCFAADFRKSLVLTKSTLVHREQANIGHIYALDGAVISQLAQKIRQKSQYIDIKSIFQQKTEFSRLKKSLHLEQMTQLAKAITQQADSHYVLFSEIDELSFDQKSTNAWRFWQQSIFKRKFAISFYLYEGVSGELAFQQTFSDQAPWRFNQRAALDVHSPAFWQSEFALMIDTLLDNVVKALDKTLICQQLRANIVQVVGNSLTLNIGSAHGLKVGDELALLHHKRFTSDAGHTYSSFELSEHSIKVTQVYRQSAKAISSDTSLLNNIQINDLAIKH